jgi:hypothetical protein
MSERQNYDDRAMWSHEKGEAVALYVADMTAQLEAMAREANWELLAYLLAIARAEAEAVVSDGRREAPSPPH